MFSVTTGPSFPFASRSIISVAPNFLISCSTQSNRKYLHRYRKMKAGQAALEDTAYFDRTRAAIVDTRAWTKQQLEQRGFAVLDSRSNFLFASTDRKDGGTLYKELKKNGILVRHFDAPRIQNWLRITIGTSEQMKIFVNTLDKIMEE